MSSTVFRIEIHPKTCLDPRAAEPGLVRDLREAGLTDLQHAWSSRLYFVEGALSRADAERIASDVIVDSVTEAWRVCAAGERDPADPPILGVEVHLRPGVMDPVAETTLEELRAEGFAVDSVRTARRYFLAGTRDERAVEQAAGRALANDCIERVIVGDAGVHAAPTPPRQKFDLRTVELRELSDDQLQQLSRDGHLFLTLEEMQAIQRHFREQGREPTDIELETLAQTWSEHCVHKTLKSAFLYRGAPMPHESDAATERRSDAGNAAARIATAAGSVERTYSNLLKDTVARATQELLDEKRGPECLSVFKDNAGIIGFDDQFGVAIKVETHNHPSAIEPYGGAATGAGGCIRDVMGCGLAARPIANTDVFCVAPSDWPYDKLPKGVLHPWRVLRGVVRGVADYGNRMGIPTVNGAVHFDPRFLGNPLVFCGCIGIIPRDKVEKAARVGDAIVVLGGRTGRDGIHGATFSSAELTDTHADEFSHAVQIGNAITEKRCLDAIMAARDHADGCLYSAITDCGAGGLSSAVGEMGESVGAAVDLDRVPLKYAGLRYDEIWISEAQERMVLAVPPDRLDRFLAIAAAEQVEATVIGTFGTEDATERRSDEATKQTKPATQVDSPRLLVRYEGTTVASLDMHFLHRGVPMRRRVAEWQPAEKLRTAGVPASQIAARQPLSRETLTRDLPAALAAPGVASKEWIIRQYDHEVQGGSAVKPLVGPGVGPADAAVLRPRPGSPRAIALGCGLAPELFDIDPYWMAAAAIDEALCNIVCVGGDPARTAILDNFCWGRSDDVHQLGALVRAAQACYDAAKAFGTPFISGKDSLNNEFALDPADAEPLIETMRPWINAERGGPLTDADLHALIAERIMRHGRLRIPGTLLVTAMSLIDDVRRCVTPDLKPSGDSIWLVGGQPRVGFSLRAADETRRALADAMSRGWIAACHDCSSGWLVALAEMAIAGNRGAVLVTDTGTAEGALDPFTPLAAGFVIQAAAVLGDLERLLAARRIPLRRVATLSVAPELKLGGDAIAVSALRAAWSTGTAR